MLIVRLKKNSIDISLNDTNAGIDYDFTSWCKMATDLRPYILGAGALIAFLIASGVIMGRNE
ncbi:virulence factor TspB C-terminal domain-related protein [Acinetobacter gerneri]|uniref:virulence factor TspB C-terminal domain-related protein n=1 Tax=Acinetobacter gerneri TaxID=202952 RepID=UPI0028AD88B3|nr:virulence factor TspB C-terminal domain-related protein [Acinetobacter gerneri]